MKRPKIESIEQSTNHQIEIEKEKNRGGETNPYPIRW